MLQQGENSTEIDRGASVEKEKKSFLYPIKSMSGVQKGYFFGGIVIAFVLGRMSANEGTGK